MARTWLKTNHPGVRYREDATRKYQRRADKYYTIRYYRGKKLYKEGVGWASEGWTAASVAQIRSEIMHNVRSGTGPQSLEEKRRMVQDGKILTDREQLLADRSTLRFRDLATRYIAHAQVTKGDWYNDALRLDAHILPLIGDTFISEISVETIRSLRNSLTGKKVNKGRTNEGIMSPATVVRCLTLIRKVFYYASITPMQENVPDIMLYEGTNPVRNVEFPKQNNARERILWKHEEAVLWPALERYPNAHDAALLSRRTGMRRGEIVSLRVEHVDIHSGALRLMDTKNGSNRTVFATDEDLLSILRRRVLCAQEMGTPWLFPNAQGDAPIAANQISKRFKVVVDDLGLNDGIADRRLQLVFHCLRHTFGTEMIIKGMSLLTLKRIMGHKILSTTERYVHIAEELQKQQAMQAIAQDGWGISMDVAQGSLPHQ